METSGSTPAREFMRLPCGDRTENEMYNYYYVNECSDKDFYTDLATERRKADVKCDGIEYEKESSIIGAWERVRVTSEEGERSIMRPMGIYDTLSLKKLDRLTEDELYDAREVLTRRLCELFDECGIFPGRILVVGFGNRNLTPDSVGPKSAAAVKPTLHISECEPDLFDELDCSEIAVFCPTVPAVCGMDSSDSVRSLCERLMPDAVLAIDSIMTKSVERLGSTIQISTTGLFPGGMGNLHSPITKAAMGAPVIGIGVPTVIDCRAACPEGFSGERLFISPREIDEITDNAAFIIGGAINQAFGLDL